jgi:uncharacterized damage-inducible protein DinB
VNQNPEKDPSEWTTGDEPMTGPQASYLKTLCQEAKVEFDEALTKAQASRRIDELQKLTGRGFSSRRGRGAARDKGETKSQLEEETEK